MAQKQIKPTVCVTWLDAAGDSRASKSDLDSALPSSLLMETKTYGILYKKDDYAVIIVQEDSADTIDYTVIPKSIITEIKILK